MISRIFAEVLEEIKRMGGKLTKEQEIALNEVHEQYNEMVVKTYAKGKKPNYCELKR
jgi:hypothetical protein